MTSQNTPTIKRPSWDEYFLNMVNMIGARSTCNRGHVGCIIVKDKRIISTGYAGSPAGLPHCDEVGHEMHTVIHENGQESRHCIRTTHAEQNAICQAARFGVSLKNATLYTNMTPCYTCAKMIINAGIIRVVCKQDYHAGQRSKEIFAQAGIKYELLNNSIVTYSDQKDNGEKTFLSLETMSDFENKINDINQNQLSKIYIYDKFNPEDNAMLQALYSRSPASVVEHIKKVHQTGSGKFMKTFYIGYGHSSIADCGSTTIFIEKISILAAKAIQDWPLYSGQETSTRYVDMSKQPIIDPINSMDSKEILNRWMDFYISNQTTVQHHLKKLYPKKADENDAVYEKAIKARTFDIMRGFLPSGITTQLSWHTNLRQAADKIALMSHHPLKEVKDLARRIHTGLKEKYPSSFSHETYEPQEKYRELINQQYNYFAPETAVENFNCSTTIKLEELQKYQKLIDERPAKTGLPHFLTELGLITFDFILDFGSFRDIQRHRNGVCRMPLLTTKFGFNSWYLEQLPDDIREKALTLIDIQTNKIKSLATDNLTRQYYIPLGFNLPCRVTYGLPAAVYVIELRSGRTVHPTLRKIAHQMHHALLSKFPNLKLYSDLEKDDWDIRRGLQDIIKKC